MSVAARKSPRNVSGSVIPAFDDWREASLADATAQQILDAEHQAFQQFFGYRIEVIVSDADCYFFIDAPQGYISREFTKAWDRRDYVRAAAAYVLMFMRLTGDDDLFVQVEGYE